MSEPLVIVGNGMAATRFVDEITSRAPNRFAITVIGEEPSLAYNRVLLSALLAREIEAEALELKSHRWWVERGVAIISGRRAVEIDTKAKAVWLRGGQKVPYSRLVLATGSEAIRLPLPGADLSGVITFRTRADTDVMLEAARPGRAAVVVGGGLLGLEAAHGLAKAGMKVTVVHLMDRLMERQLDQRSAAMLKAALDERGITVLLSAESAAIQGRRKATGLRLKDGRVIDADLVVMAAGVRPNVRLARAAGLSVERGIVVDDRLMTSVPGIFAIGECAEHNGVCYGLVEPAYEQARVAGAHLAGEDARYGGSLLATNLKVSGLGVFSAGDFLGGPDTESIVLSDPTRGAYRKVVLREGRLAGAVLLGDTADALWYLDLLRSQVPIAKLRSELVFGRAFVEPSAEAA
jgi:nitrite reductase (NADH) large subunit